jgi:glyoxylase-like metal-dependent hydrolase (beta-lactamase superfamily II)
MTYTGDVVVGGDAAVRELPDLVISKLAVGEYNNNAYLLRCTKTGSQVLIDAAAEPERLITLIGDGGLDAIVTTHAHRDHWAALEQVAQATGAITIAHEIDAYEIGVPTNRKIDEGAEIEVGDVTLSVIHLVGHTPGSIALIYNDPTGAPHIWTGDCLFPGGVGNTWSDPERFASLFEGVRAKIFDALPDETWVYPGHGSDTTLGTERPQLDEWLTRGW